MLPFHIPPSDELRQIQQNQQLQQLHEQQQRQANQNQGRPRSRRVFYTTSPDIAAQGADQEYTLILVDQEELRWFIKKVYFCVLIFTVIACLTWGAVIIIEFKLENYVNFPVFIWILAAFVVLMLMSCVQELHYYNHVTLICVICIMFFYIMAGVGEVNLITFKEYIIGVLLTFVTQLAIHVAATFFLKNSLLGFDFFLFVFISLLVVMPILLIISIFIASTLLRILSVLICVFLFMILSIYQAQYLHGQYEIFPLDDVYAVSLSIFTQSALLLYCFELLYHMLRVSA